MGLLYFKSFKIIVFETRSQMKNFQCRKGCGACCIAPSISSPIPGMPDGKPAGLRCIQLTEYNLCSLYGKPERPEFCASYRASEDFCGGTRGEALELIAVLEAATETH
jgi:Fe-S-cluster containining protein